MLDTQTDEGRMTDVDWLNQYRRSRDAEAFAQLVQRYQRLIFSTCRRRLHDSADVDDAVQETFLRMAKAAGSLRSNVGGWLHRCAVNVSTDYNRRREARLRYEGQAPAASTTAASQGHFDIELVGPGVYQAQASVPDYAWTWGPEARAEKVGQDAETILKLQRGGTLIGRIVSPTSQPVAGVKVIPQSMAGEASYRASKLDDSGAVVTDASGNFQIQHLVAGDETVKVIDADFAPKVVAGLKIEDGKTVQAPPIVLQVGGSIEGVVYDSGGHPGRGVTIDCQDDAYYHYGQEHAQHRLGSAVTDEQGHYRIDHLPEQDVYAVISYDSQASREGVSRRMVHPKDGQVLPTDFGGTTPVHGRLLSAGKPKPQQHLTFSIGDPSFGTTMVYVRTDDEGRFTLFGPPPGDYSVSRDDAPAFNRRLLLGDFKLGVGDIGDIVEDVGELSIHVNPVDAEKIQYIEIERADESAWWKRMLGSATAGADKSVWLSRDIPAGNLVAIVRFKDAGWSWRYPLQRMAGVTAASISLPHPPEATATLAPKSVAADASSPRWMLLRAADGTIDVTLSEASGASAVKVPPGNYRQIDNGEGKPVPGGVEVQAITGQVTQIDLAHSKSAKKSIAK